MARGKKMAHDGPVETDMMPPKGRGKKRRGKKRGGKRRK